MLTQALNCLSVDFQLLKYLLQVLLYQSDRLDASVVLGFQHHLLPLLHLQPRLQLLSVPIRIVLGGGTSKASFLNLLLLLGDLRLQLLDFLVELVDEVRHDGIFLIEPYEDIQKLLARAFDTGLADSDFLLDALERTANFGLFLQALSVLRVDLQVRLLLEFDRLLVLADLLFQLGQRFLLLLLALNEVLEAHVVLDLLIQLVALVLECQPLLLCCFL